jgi:phosphoglycerate dehydrogenase-like enzyme
MVMPEIFIEEMRSDYPSDSVVICNDNAELMNELPDADVLFGLRFTQDMLDSAKQMKWVQSLSAGIDQMPLENMAKRGVLLTNGRGIHKIHMTEYAIASMIMMARNFHVMSKNQFKGSYDRNVSQGQIHGATVGIIGLGSIGTEIARISKLLGMKVLAIKSSKADTPDFIDHAYPREDMVKVFEESDYVINLLPSTKGTIKLIDKKYFSAMKDTAVFINMGRGTTVNEEDMIKVLQSRSIKGVVTDVYNNEPLAEDSPLWKMDNIIMTPHICGENPNYMKMAYEIFKKNLRVFASGQGEMINKVDMNKGY